MRMLWISLAAMLLAACTMEQNPPTDEIATCLPPQMVLVNPAESQHIVKKVYLHDEFNNYKDERNVVAADIALGERTEPFELCAANFCSVKFFITYTREKILGSVETVAVTTESAQDFHCGTRYTVYLLGEDFYITKGPARNLNDSDGPDDDILSPY